MNSIFTVLLLVGYSDLNPAKGFEDLYSHIFQYDNGALVEAEVRSLLALKDFEEDPVDPHALEKDGLRFVIWNANVNCPGEDTYQVRRTRVCDQQVQRSREIRRNLDEKLTRQFKEFIYLGHARHGNGLGIGPYFEEFTYKLAFYNAREAGELERVVMATCDGNKYYRYNVAGRTKIDFEGTDGTKSWITDDLPMVLKEVDTLTRQFRRTAQ